MSQLADDHYANFVSTRDTWSSTKLETKTLRDMADAVLLLGIKY